ncbi:hypothetical protein D3C73_700240 [compost metagenome]
MLKCIEQQRCERIEQAADGIDLHGQLNHRFDTRMQRQEVFAVDVIHVRSRVPQAYQHIGQGFVGVFSGNHVPCADHPGRAHDRGERRIDFQMGIQRSKRWPQHIGGHFTDQGASDQFGQ